MESYHNRIVRTSLDSDNLYRYDFGRTKGQLVFLRHSLISAAFFKSAAENFRHPEKRGRNRCSQDAEQRGICTI